MAVVRSPAIRTDEPAFGILRLDDDPLAALALEAQAEGHRFIDRMVREWQTGANRFDRTGETLLGAMIGGQVVAVGGLNLDPYDS